MSINLEYLYVYLLTIKSYRMLLFKDHDTCRVIVTKNKSMVENIYITSFGPLFLAR